MSGSRAGFRAPPPRARPSRLRGPLQRRAPAPLLGSCSSGRATRHARLPALLGRPSPGRARRADPRVLRCGRMSGRARGVADVFVVARNPEADSKLPYLLRLPLEGGLLLKARESWPTTSRVYCHRFEGAWLKGAETVDETAVVLCRRRGAAIDLVLDRPRLARSQFVFTQVKGREAIFWQTQKTARTANPGGRIPRRRTLTDAVTIAVDTRERYPYRFAQQGAETVRATVPAGDYAAQTTDGSVFSAVDRKILENL